MNLNRTSNELETILKFLKEIQSYSPLEDHSEKALANICFTQKVGKNEVLQEIGKTCKTIYFVMEGSARIFYLKDGLEITEYFAFKNDLIVRAESLFKSLPSNKGIVSIEETLFVGIPSNALFSLFDEFHDIERLFRILIQTVYLETIKRLESIQFQTAEERYKGLLENHPEFIQKIPLKHIASYLGITQVSLSRIRAGIS